MIQKIETLEIELLLEALYRRYGYDFRHYVRDTIVNGLHRYLPGSGVSTIAELIPLVIYNPEAAQGLLMELSITVTQMFRNPSFFLAIRERVIPVLKKFPYINIWCAGCATGEEVYSIAIILQEEGLYERSRIYATDINDVSLQTAKNRTYPLEKMKVHTANYQQAGGKRSLADYYHAQYDAVIFSAALQKNITFANHNLITDAVFAEMHLILCRNVLIYFDEFLQQHVVSLFQNSLCHQGFLGLGRAGALPHSLVSTCFSLYDHEERIYQCQL